ncbi:MAG: TolC family protein, partial [Clostridiaceae bacterium]|nr:TolC family protein [Clostridiaceae bacterium]
MKKLCFALSFILCAASLFGSITAFAGAMDDGLLTLEEAKELALKNDVSYNQQDDKIQDALEDYEELSESTSAGSGRGSNSADKAASRISYKVQLENAYSAVRKAVLTKADLKRSSDSEVTDMFYAVIEAQNSAASAQTDLDMKKKELETAEVKYGLSIINKSSLSQAESSYRSSESAYNKAVLELENCVLKLAKSIGAEVDLSKVKLDTALSIPDISTLDLEKIKEDNLKNNLTYFSAKEQYKLAEYELALTEEKYEDYFDEHKNSSESVEEAYDNLLYDAEQNFEDAEENYNEKLEDLEESLEDQYNSLTDLYESYTDLKEDIEDAKLTVKQDKIKYQMRLI